MSQSNRTRRTPSQWREILSAFAASGLSQPAFCQQEGLALSTFQNWKRRLGAPPSDGRNASPSPNESVSPWVDLGELPDRRIGWEIELALGDGLTLTLRRS